MSDEEIVEDGKVDDQKAAIESQAKVLGWRPKEEFVGDPDNWRDADEYLQYGRDTLPVLRENNKRLISEVQDLKKTFKEFSEHHKQSIIKTEKQAYEKAMADLSEKQRKAVEDQDVETFDKLEKEKEKLEPPVDVQPKKDGAGQGAAKSPEMKTWEKENPWYDGDSLKEVRMTARANEIASVLHGKGVPFDDMLKQVKDAIKEEYPDHFKNQNAKKESAVSTPSRGAGKGTGKKGKTFEDLPDDAKAACRRFEKQGLMKKEDYVKEYFLGEE
jgi:hypothetical protein